ncbi:hypothetical protein Tco_1310553 [Tanacetum coccineum]
MVVKWMACTRSSKCHLWGFPYVILGKCLKEWYAKWWHKDVLYECISCPRLVNGLFIAKISLQGQLQGIYRPRMDYKRMSCTGLDKCFCGGFLCVTLGEYLKDWSTKSWHKDSELRISFSFRMRVQQKKIIQVLITSQYGFELLLKSVKLLTSLQWDIGELYSFLPLYGFPTGFYMGGFFKEANSLENALCCSSHIVDGIMDSKVDVLMLLLKEWLQAWGLSNANVFKTMFFELRQLYEILKENEEEAIDVRTKKAAKNHDPLALVAHTYNAPQKYDFQAGEDNDDPVAILNKAMMLLARAFTQQYSTPTTNRLRTSSNTYNQAYMQGGRIDFQGKSIGYAGNTRRNVKSSSTDPRQRVYANAQRVAGRNLQMLELHRLLSVTIAINKEIMRFKAKRRGNGRVQSEKCTRKVPQEETTA